MELLRDGLTFDLLGIAPGLSLSIPAPCHRFGLAKDSFSGAKEAIGLFPGPHLVEGSHTLPVLRTLMALAVDLVRELPAVETILWTPARAALSRVLFASVTETWLDGGAFPAPGLIGFMETATGGLITDGLAFFIGQELELEPALSTDRVSASRLATRIADRLVGGTEPFFPETLVIEGWPPLLLQQDGSPSRIRATLA